MFYDFLVILLIVGFSYIFNLAHTKQYNQQLVFILLSLVIMVVYKYLQYQQIAKGQILNTLNGNKEGYNDFHTEINEFLQMDTSKASNDNLTEYNKKLDNLNDKVDIMNEYLSEIKEQSNQKQMTGDGSKDSELNIQASQQIQDYRIRNMQKEIQRTTDLIKQAKMQEDAASYKKIPIYSSCLVSNADGSVTADSPSQVTDASGNVVRPLMNVNNITGVSNDVSVSSTPGTVQNSSSVSGRTQGQQGGQTGAFNVQSLLNNILNTGEFPEINVNVK